MDRIKYLEELERRAEEGGGENRLRRHHDAGKLTARERIDLLFDKGSFLETGMHGTVMGTPVPQQVPADGVVCGHIHKPDMRVIDGIHYDNDGDRVDSCTALVEHLDGRMELLEIGRAPDGAQEPLLPFEVPAEPSRATAARKAVVCSSTPMRAVAV